MHFTLRAIKTLTVVGALLLASAPALLAQDNSDHRTAWLGVSIQDVTEELSQTLPRGVSEGALVNSVVEGSPAETAGLTEGDVIVKIEQTRVHNSKDLTDAMRSFRVGQTAVIEYYRDGRRMRTEAVLSGQEDELEWQPRAERRGRRQRTQEPGMYYFDTPSPRAFAFMTGATPRLGVGLVDLTPQLSEYFGVESGVLVSEVKEESAAQTAGLKAGDVITEVGGKPTSDSREVREELSAVESGPVTLTVIRNGKPLTVTAELERRSRSRMSGFHGPSAPMFNIPEVTWDQEEFKAEMEQLREEMKQLQKELSDMRGDSR